VGVGDFEAEAFDYYFVGHFGGGRRDMCCCWFIIFERVVCTDSFFRKTAEQSLKKALSPTIYLELYRDESDRGTPNSLTRFATNCSAIIA